MKRISDLPGLVGAGLLPAESVEALHRVASRWAVALTPAVQARIDPADPADPIARQFVPSESELSIAPDELEDPIGDASFTPLKGITHRYPDRVLLKPTHACPVYCRFCFRREAVGPGGESLTPAELGAALDYVAREERIWEVILSGGDPLILSPRRLAEIIRRLDAIPHLGVIRVHTRVPAVEPERVTAELVEALRARKAVWIVLHANHARELDERTREAVARLVDAGLPMLSQTVLLAGVNDDPASLEALFRAFVAMRVKPYYLHHADLAPGTGHFRTSIASGQALVRSLRGRVSGLCQPSYVLDVPGGAGKVPIGPSYLRERADGDTTVIEDWQGKLHRYSDFEER